MNNLEYAEILQRLARDLQERFIEITPQFEQAFMRNGRPARIYCHDGKGGRPVHGAMLESDGGWEMATWSLNGHFGCEDRETCLDLMPERVERDARVLAEERHSGTPWDELTDWNRQDCLADAIARVASGAGRL